MSEHHYDEPIDEISTYRLLNFGDDYRKFIDSLSDNPNSGDEKRKSKKNRRTRKNRVSIHVQ